MLALIGVWICGRLVGSVVTPVARRVGPATGAVKNFWLSA